MLVLFSLKIRLILAWMSPVFVLGLGIQFFFLFFRTEAFLSNFEKALGLPAKEFECAVVGFKGDLMITFKTKNAFNFQKKLPDIPGLRAISKEPRAMEGEKNSHTYNNVTRDKVVPNSMTPQRRICRSSHGYYGETESVSRDSFNRTIHQTDTISETEQKWSHRSRKV